MEFSPSQSPDAQPANAASRRKSSSLAMEEMDGIGLASETSDIRRVQQLVTQSPLVQSVAQRQRAVIQRDFDDSAKARVTLASLQVLWTKIRARTANAVPPISDATVQAGLGAVNTAIGGRAMTEREVAEELSQERNLRGLLMGHRVKPTSAAADRPTKAIRETMYYHATFVSVVPSILAEGLSASHGGSGAGASTHARGDGGASRAARETYNKWSKGFYFVTADAREAESYAKKMRDKSGEATQIIHVFSDPDYTSADMMPDVDSKAGLKDTGGNNAIGDGVHLNATAQHRLASWAGCSKAEVLDAYVAITGGAKIFPAPGRGLSSSTGGGGSASSASASVAGGASGSAVSESKLSAVTSDLRRRGVTKGEAKDSMPKLESARSAESAATEVRTISPGIAILVAIFGLAAITLAIRRFFPD